MRNKKKKVCRKNLQLHSNPYSDRNLNSPRKDFFFQDIGSILGVGVPTTFWWPNLKSLSTFSNSERPIQENFVSADTDNRQVLPILSADISAKNEA